MRGGSLASGTSLTAQYGGGNFVARNFTGGGIRSVPAADGHHAAAYRGEGLPRLHGFGSWGGYGVFRRVGVNPIQYGWPFGLYGVGWGGPLWWAIGYPGWGIYGSHAARYPLASAQQIQKSADAIARGEREFRAGQYQDALRDWEHAMVDTPTNGAVALLAAQALFALGRFDDAAGAVQMGMQLLDQDQWGNVVRNYPQLYPDIGRYTNQLRELENARDATPSDPALRFLLGYHFGYLGYPRQAARELDKALELEPKDLGSQRLREVLLQEAHNPGSAEPHSRAVSVPQTTLNRMGLRHVQPLSDVEGETIHGWGAVDRMLAP
jgi:Tfp pilus assembly protein PilF